MKIRTIAENRKDVVKAVSEIMGETSKYMGVPSYGYRIGECIVNRKGEVEVPDEKLGDKIFTALVERGLAEQETEGQEIEIKIPMGEHTGVSLKNLVFMLKSKQYLLNKAIGRNAFEVDEGFVSKLQESDVQEQTEFLQLLHECKGNENNRGFYFTEDAIVFEGFPLSEDAAEMKAYVELSAGMCATALSSKRVNPKETLEENEKYYMRVWLIRLGLGGAEGKDTRRNILKNLKGHSAFRTEEEIERAKIRSRQRADAEKE